MHNMYLIFSYSLSFAVLIILVIVIVKGYYVSEKKFEDLNQKHEE